MVRHAHSRSLLALLCLAVLLVLVVVPSVAIPFAIFQPLLWIFSCLLALVAILAAANESNSPVPLLTRVAAPRAPPVR